MSGRPNVAAILVIKSTSRLPNQPACMLHSAQLSRAACGPALEPMMARLLPQARQPCGVCTRSPIMGEFANGGAVSNDDDDITGDVQKNPIAWPCSKGSA